MYQLCPFASDEILFLISRKKLNEINNKRYEVVHKQGWVVLTTV